jgi:hypothetical protein
MDIQAILEARLSDWSAGPMAFVILALATWRLTSLVVREEGPWCILARLRHRIGVRSTDAGVPYGLNVMAEGLTCVWCTSVWTATFLALSYVWMPAITICICVPLALSAGALLIEKGMTE